MPERGERHTSSLARQRELLPLSALPPKADKHQTTRFVRFVPKADICIAAHICYSITSSAATRSLSGTVRPSIVAVWTLKTSSNLVACTTGKSATFAPLRMRPA